MTREVFYIREVIAAKNARERAYNNMKKYESSAYSAATYRRAVRMYRRAVDAHNAARQQSTIKTLAAMMVNGAHDGRQRKSNAILIPLPDITCHRVRYKQFSQARDDIEIERIKRTWRRVAAVFD